MNLIEAFLFLILLILKILSILSILECSLNLLERAREAAQGAYCPYSNFHVGAAVETDAGIFVGCNVENASYGLSICAERVALFAAVAAGAKRVIRLAVSCVDAGPDDPPQGKMPCGACRQVIAEFMAQDAEVEIDGVGILRVAELLPAAFLLETQPFLQPSLIKEEE